MSNRIYELSCIVESLLFVLGDPIKISDIASGLNISVVEAETVIEKLSTFYIKNDRGLRIKVFNDSVQMCTDSNNANYIEKVLQPIQKQSLSSKAMEALAVIAYKQPITKFEIEQIRGVKSDYSIVSLLSKGLIQAVGKKDTVGNPTLYGTTDEFLSHFGIKSLSELPQLLPLQEINDINNEKGWE